MSQNYWDKLCQWIADDYSKSKNIEQILQASLRAGWEIGAIEQAIKLTLGIDLEPSRLAPFPSLGKRSFIDLEDCRVHIIASMKNPNLLVVRNILSEGECEALIELAKPKLTRSQVLEYGTGITKVGNERTSEGVFFRRSETELITRIEQRIAHFLDWPADRGEGLQVLRYGVGQEFKPHHDFFTYAAPSQRVATLLIYLNDPDEGGSTIFPDVNLEIFPKKGHAVFFSYDRPYAYTRTLHGGSPVISGEKWVATKWFHSQHFKESPIAEKKMLITEMQ